MGNARTVMNGQITEALLHLAEKRASAHGQVITSNAGSIAHFVVTTWADNMADWDQLTHPQRNRVRG